MAEDVVVPAAEDVVVPPVDDVAAPLVDALVVEVSDVAADEVVATTDEVVVAAVVADDAAVVAPIDVAAPATVEAVLLSAVLLAAVPLAVAEDCARAGTGVTVGDVAVPVALALHAASKVTPLAAPSLANSCKQRRRSSWGKAVGRADIACSLTKRC